jgi:hypothetical protein
MKKLGKTEFRECLQFFVEEYFVFQFATEDISITINRTIIVYVFIWVYNLVCHNEGGTVAEREFENRVLTMIFGPKRDAVTGEWGGLHNKEFRHLYTLPILYG